jgi:hypothetical protein
MKLSILPKFAALLAACLLFANYSYAQEKQQSKSEETSKKVIVKKIDGTEGTKEIKVIVNTDDIDIDTQQKVQVEINEIDGEKDIRIELKPVDGDAEIIEWKGEGDLPEDIREKLESKGVYLHELDKDAEKGVFIYKDGTQDGSFNWVSDDTPGAFLGVIGAHEAKITVIVDEEGEETVTESPESPAEGLVIGSVVEGSAAELAGLKKGDVLREIDNTTLEDFSDLVEFMRNTEVGQQVSLTYERDGQVKETQATLQERKAGQGNVIIERISDDKEGGNVFFFRTEGDGDEVKIHQKHRVVVITRGEKDEPGEKSVEITPLVPDSELKRTLTLNDYTLFPNPTEDHLRLRFAADAAPIKIEINDLNGKNVYRERLNQFDGRYDEDIDVSDLPSGIYLLTVEQNDKVYTEQFVVK